MLSPRIAKPNVVEMGKKDKCEQSEVICNVGSEMAMKYNLILCMFVTGREMWLGSHIHVQGMCGITLGVVVISSLARIFW